jgi:hypothetical protein
MVIKWFLRFGAIVPVVALALLPDAVSADSGLAVSIGSTGTRASLGVLVPISVSCPAPSSDPSLSQSLFGKLTVIQANGNSKVAIGVATLASGGKGAFGSAQPGVDLICDGTSHSYQALVLPDTQTDPFTAALTGGQATANLSLTLFTFACPPCFSPTTTTVTSGPVEIHIKG